MSNVAPIKIDTTDGRLPIKDKGLVFQEFAKHVKIYAGKEMDSTLKMIVFITSNVIQHQLNAIPVLNYFLRTYYTNVIPVISTCASHVIKHGHNKK